LLAIGERVTFRHPLVRSAVYRAASPAERRAAHQALADATDPQADPDRRAWHRAQAASGPDEEVAAELERSAGRAQARGGLAAAAAFLERAALLTLDPARRAGRALAAAQAKYQAGAFDAALRLLATAEAGPPDQFRRARADLLRGQIAFASSRGSDAPPLLLKAARQFEPLDSRLARETYLDALAAATFAGRLALGGGMREVAEAARMAPPQGPTRGPDLLLDGLARLICEGYSAAPVLRRAVNAFRGTDLSREEGLRWLWLACRAALIVWDYASFDVLSDRQIALARDAGALITLPIAFNMRSMVHVFAGEFTEAASMVAQAESVTEVTGSSIAPYGALGLAVFRGRETQAAYLIQTATDDAGRRGEGRALSFIGWPTQCCATAWAATRRRWQQRSGRARTRLRCSSPAGRSSSSSRRRHGVRYPSARLAPFSGSPASPEPAGPTGRLAPRPARERWSATGRPPRTSTAKQSTASAAPACGWISPAPACFTASGCAASGADVTPASSSAARTRSSTRPAPQRSPNGRASS
jgi:tetratricopeptide (TPR) repeat protein